MSNRHSRQVTSTDDSDSHVTRFSSTPFSATRTCNKLRDVYG